MCWMYLKYKSIVEKNSHKTVSFYLFRKYVYEIL